MPPPYPAMIYGATGYTGRLIAREAARRGLVVTLAGRNDQAGAALSEELRLPWACFALDDPGALRRHLTGRRVVLNCAGPFAHTAPPMMQACLAEGVDYLDITGEIDVIERAAALDAEARRAGVALLPAVGFDVAPSDCLAAMLAARLPGATHLQLAISSTDPFSPGTAKTVVEMIPKGGRARVDGQIVPVPLAWKTRSIPFRDGEKLGMTIPWGDVASAYYSTGIPNIEVYAATTPGEVSRLRLVRPLLPVFKFGLIQNLARRWISRRVPGPTADQLQAGRSSLWGQVTLGGGQVTDGGGQGVSATLLTQSAYRLTANTATSALAKALQTILPAGFHTPSQAFGSEWILSFADTDLTWDSPATR